MSDRDTIKDVLRLFSYGLYVASAIGPDGPRAATVSWVTQASFEPRLIAVAMRKGTAICEAVAASRRFALAVVTEDQADFAKAFFRAGPAGPDAIGGYRFSLSANGLGDHTIFICRVVGGGQREPALPALALRDTAWHYGG